MTAALTIPLDQNPPVRLACGHAISHDAMKRLVNTHSARCVCTYVCVCMYVCMCVCEHFSVFLPNYEKWICEGHI